MCDYTCVCAWKKWVKARCNKTQKYSAYCTVYCVFPSVCIWMRSLCFLWWCSGTASGILCLIVTLPLSLSAPWDISFTSLLLSQALHSLISLLSLKFLCQKLCLIPCLYFFSSSPSFRCPLLSFTHPSYHSLCLSPLPSSRGKDITEILSSQPLLIPNSVTKINKSPIGSKQRREGEKEEEKRGERNQKRQTKMTKSWLEREISDNERLSVNIERFCNTPD